MPKTNDVCGIDRRCWWCEYYIAIRGGHSAVSTSCRQTSRCLGSRFSAQATAFSMYDDDTMCGAPGDRDRSTIPRASYMFLPSTAPYYSVASPLVHFGAVVADAPSPLSTPRSATGQAQLRLGKPLRMNFGALWCGRCRRPEGPPTTAELEPAKGNSGVKR